MAMFDSNCHTSLKPVFLWSLQQDGLGTVTHRDLGESTQWLF